MMNTIGYTENLIGYKATNNGKCRNDFLYKVGKTYEYDGKIELCKSGFHFCKNADDIFSYYDYIKGVTKIFEVKILGIYHEGADKSVTNLWALGQPGIRDVPQGKPCGTSRIS